MNSDLLVWSLFPGQPLRCTPTSISSNSQYFPDPRLRYSVHVHVHVPYYYPPENKPFSAIDVAQIGKGLNIRNASQV
jgi:hypothetical protein